MLRLLKIAIYMALAGYMSVLIYYAVRSATPHDSLPGFTIALYAFFLEPLSWGVHYMSTPTVNAIPLWPDPEPALTDTIARVCTAGLFSTLVALGVKKFG